MRMSTYCECGAQDGFIFLFWNGKKGAHIMIQLNGKDVKFIPVFNTAFTHVIYLCKNI